MNSIIQLSFAVLIVFIAACESQDQPVVEESRIDLGAWQKVGDDPWRLAESGVEAGPAEAVGFLVSNDTYDDVTLSIEYWVEDDTNSGIFIRCSNAQDIGRAIVTKSISGIVTRTRSHVPAAS